MSTVNRRDKTSWGGARVGAGRPKGSGQKVKICVSVDKEKWEAALIHWTDKPSRLVNLLVSVFVKNAGGKTKAGIA